VSENPCVGPVYFAGPEVMCCEDHEIEVTRNAALRSRISSWKLASMAGCHAVDMAWFLVGTVSLTPHIRARLRSGIGRGGV